MNNINVFLSIIILTNLMLVVVSSSSRRNKNEKGDVYAVYLLNIATIVWWIGSMILTRIAHEENINFISKNLYASATLIASSFYYFSLIFPNFSHQNIKKNIKKLICVVLLNIVLIAMIFLTPTIISGGEISQNGENIAFFGELFPIYVAYILFFFCSSFFRLFTKHLKETDVTKKSQLLIICFGYTISGFTAFVTNLLLPALGNFSWIWLGPVSTVIVAIAITIAVTKHHLFYIKIISAEVFVFLLWVLSLLKISAFESLQGSVAWKHATENIVFLVIWLTAGIFLIKSVKRQAEQHDENLKLVHELDLANKELRELDLIKTKFVSLARHNMASPLTAMNSYASLIKEGSIRSKKIGFKNLEGIIDRFIVIVRDFLSISQIEEGKINYANEKVDLEEILREAISERQVKIDYHNLEIQFDIEAGQNFIVRGDSEKIKTAVSNVLENSIQYSKNSKINIILLRMEQKIMLKITDVGVRSLPNVSQELVKKFSPEGNQQQANLMGNGLGLYMAKRIIEAQSGEMHINYDKDQSFWEFRLKFQC